MDELIKEQIRLTALQAAFGQVLASNHLSEKLDGILDAMSDSDQNILDENDVLVCELYENDDITSIASRIQELADAFYSATIAGFNLGAQSGRADKERQWLDSMGIQHYVINEHGLVDVEGDVDLSEKSLTELPVKFGRVSGGFYCSDNQLTSLAGAPQNVGGYFSCRYNRLTSLEGAPQTVGGDFYCCHNQLTSLEGAPQTVGGDFYCHHNQLTSLEGSPKTVVGHFYCCHNQLTSLEGAPQTVGGGFYCNGNTDLPDNAADVLYQNGELQKKSTFKP